MLFNFDADRLTSNLPLPPLSTPGTSIDKKIQPYKLCHTIYVNVV